MEDCDHSERDEVPFIIVASPGDSEFRVYMHRIRISQNSLTQLMKMGSYRAVPDSFKDLLLLSSIGTNTNNKSTYSALRIRNKPDLYLSDSSK